MVWKKGPIRSSGTKKKFFPSKIRFLRYNAGLLKGNGEKTFHGVFKFFPGLSKLFLFQINTLRDESSPTTLFSVADSKSDFDDDLPARIKVSDGPSNNF